MKYFWIKNINLVKLTTKRMHTSRAHRKVPGVEPFAGIIGSNVVGFLKDRPFLGWIGRSLKPFWKDRHQLKKKKFKSYSMYTENKALLFVIPVNSPKIKFWIVNFSCWTTNLGCIIFRYIYYIIYMAQMTDLAFIRENVLTRNCL